MSLPIMPPATMKRSPKIQECFLYWIKGNELGRTATFTEVAQHMEIFAQANNSYLANIAKEDGWEAHRMALLQEKIEATEVTDMVVYNRYRGSAEEIERIRDEEIRQVEEIPALETEAKRVISAISLTPVQSKAYSTMVKTLDVLAGMLEKRSGKSRYDVFMADIGKAQIRLEEKQAEENAGKNMSDAKVVEV